MLPSQRALFDIPRDVCYLNASGWSPLPRATQEAACAAVSRKGQPWKLGADFALSREATLPFQGGINATAQLRRHPESLQQPRNKK